MIECEVIPFPRAGMADGPEDRLCRAVASLDAALAEQRAAVRAWRQNCLELSLAAGLLAKNASDATTRLAVAAEQTRALAATPA